MATSVERVAELERANYAAMLPSAQVTPGLEVKLREDVIFTTTRAFPSPDMNHASLLRAPPEAIDALIEQVKGYFQSRELAAAVYVSPACTPDDLPERLSQGEFVAHADREAWMVVEPHAFRLTQTSAAITVRQIAPDEALVYAEVFLKAFDLPSTFALQMAELLEPSIGLRGTHHYLAFRDGEAIGTASLLCFEDKGIFGGTGVVPQHRQSRAGTNLAAAVKSAATSEGVRSLMLQTTADTWLEERLHMHGFRRVFTRTPYILAQ